MAYDPARFKNLPNASMDGMHQEHEYLSIADNVATAQGAGFFSDYASRGPNRIGDLIHFKQVTLAADGNVATIVAAATLMVTAIDAAGAATAGLKQAFA